jgi:hypothetical protein
MRIKQTIYLLVFFAITTVLLLSSCGGGGGPSGPGPVVGNISGYVKELASEQGLDNFTVKVGDKYTETSNGGYYQMKAVQDGLPIEVTGSIDGQSYTMLCPATVVIINQGGDNPQPTIYMIASPPEQPNFKKFP